MFQIKDTTYGNISGTVSSKDLTPIDTFSKSEGYSIGRNSEGEAVIMKEWKPTDINVWVGDAMVNTICVTHEIQNKK